MGSSFRDGSSYLYRNQDCLLCEQEQPDIGRVSCYDPDRIGARTVGLGQRRGASSGESSSSSSTVAWYDSMTRNAFDYGIPPSISVLINFGLEDKLIMYAAVNAIHDCRPDQMWDPFSLVCRDVYCATGFDLVQFQCIEDPSEPSLPPGASSPQPVVLPSSEVSITVAALVFDHFHEEQDDVGAKVESLFADQYAKFCYISPDRVTAVNVTSRGNRTLATHDDVVETLANATYALWAQVGYTTGEALLSYDELRHLIRTLDQFTDAYEFRVDFLLEEVAANRTVYEATNDEVVAMTAAFISENAFKLSLDEVLNLRITSMYERALYTAEELYEWCRGGILATYNHRQINITMLETVNNDTGYEDWSMEVSKRRTGAPIAVAILPCFRNGRLTGDSPLRREKQHHALNK